VLRGEYRAIADRRVKLGLLLSDIGRLNEIQVSQAELSQALRAEASRYPGQEMQVIKFFQENAGAIEQLRGPIFEDKVVDYILSVAQVAERVVPPEELALPDAGAAVAVAAPEAAEENLEPVEAAAADVEAEGAAPAAAEDAENAA
jgi:trigger factor